MRNKNDVISNITDNIRRVFQILNEQSQRIRQETGLTGPQLWAIRVIHEHGPINISDIARRMYLHPTTVLGIADRLEARGLVSRNRSKDDRRVMCPALGLEDAPGRIMTQTAARPAAGLVPVPLLGLEAPVVEERCPRR